jgi:hypothetical protein
MSSVLWNHTELFPRSKPVPSQHAYRCVSNRDCVSCGLLSRGLYGSIYSNSGSELKWKGNSSPPHRLLRPKGHSKIRVLTFKNDGWVDLYENVPRLANRWMPLSGWNSQGRNRSLRITVQYCAFICRSTVQTVIQGDQSKTEPIFFLKSRVSKRDSCSLKFGNTVKTGN